MSIQSAFDDFILALMADGLKPKTIAWYKTLLIHLIEAFPDKQLSDITTRDLRVYIVGLRTKTTHWNGSQRREQPGGFSEDTINAHVRALHKFWKWCSKEYRLPNPMAEIRYPKKPDAKPKNVEMPDVLKLFDACGGSRASARDRAILAFLIDTGCRAGGVVGLLRANIDLAEQKALVTEKGGKTRTVYFIKATALLLEAWIQTRAPVQHLFYNLETLEPLTTFGLRSLLKRLAKRAGVVGRVNPHSFRHSFAREYLRAGGDLSTLSRLMGHRDVTTTVHHYAIFTQDEVKEAHEKYSPARLLGEDKKEASSGDEASD
ncbi:MAG: tyrosine-type recombinase/integrase [Chloroflexota bacterium]|nr:tyrosine-type recombinase/integrase [Chloroflexota bacterium]